LLIKQEPEETDSFGKAENEAAPFRKHGFKARSNIDSYSETYESSS
jgi:hypothetical protein